MIKRSAIGNVKTQNQVQTALTNAGWSKQAAATSLGIKRFVLTWSI